MKFTSSANEIRKKIQHYSYALNDAIGKGLTSTVFQGISQLTHQPLAIKVIDLKSLKDKCRKQMLEGQIDALRKVNHSNILKCFDIYSTQNNCYIITEFCNEGDLQHLIAKRQKLPQIQALPIFRDLLKGFRAIIQAGFLHRDLKPANILLSDKTVKIADFGFAKRITAQIRDDVNVGSPLYMSPQSLKRNIYTVKSEIWSLGIILYEVLHGRTPWKAWSQEELKQKISHQPLLIDPGFSEDLKDFLTGCLMSDESQRLGMNELYAHPFAVRILEQDGVPQLVRKKTSAYENVPQNKEMMGKISKNIMSLHHRQNHRASENSAEKQLNSQINYMRFLYRLCSMLPPCQNNGKYAIGLRLLAKKQIFIQLQNLKKALNRDNVFNFDNWEQFTKDKQRVQKYKQVLFGYGKKYESIHNSYMNEIKAAITDRKLSSVANDNFTRSEGILILSIYYAVRQCRRVLSDLKERLAFTEEDSRRAVRLDFTITFYQLNCMLMSSFHELSFFGRECGLEEMCENKPFSLEWGNVKDLEQKMMLLEIMQ